MGRVSQDKGLESIRDRLEADPANVDLANDYWNALASYKGSDTRSGAFVVQAYRGAALKSKEGVIAFAPACRELFEVSGEAPRAAYFDTHLVRALESWLQQLPDAERANLQWVLRSISNR